MKAFKEGLTIKIIEMMKTEKKAIEVEEALEDLILEEIEVAEAAEVAEEAIIEEEEVIWVKLFKIETEKEKISNKFRAEVEEVIEDSVVTEADMIEKKELTIEIHIGVVDTNRIEKGEDTHSINQAQNPTIEVKEYQNLEVTIEEVEEERENETF